MVIADIEHEITAEDSRARLEAICERCSEALRFRGPRNHVWQYQAQSVVRVKLNFVFPMGCFPYFMLMGIVP